ncbi:MAG: histidine kinase dimerization/phospho-acceptor domain-containing protein, partial [Bacteroidota bacterium]
MKLHFKIFGIVCIISIGLFFYIFVTAYIVLSREAKNEVTYSLSSANQCLSQFYLNIYKNNLSSGLDSVFIKEILNIKIPYIILDTNNNCLYPLTDSLLVREKKSTEIIISNFKQQKTFNQDTSFIFERNNFLFAVRLMVFSNQVSAYLISYADLSRTDNLVINRLKEIIFDSILFILLALIILFIILKKISTKINQFDFAAKRISKGDFKVKVFLKETDELKRLADSFNFMTEYINNLFEKLSHTNEELKSIIGSIRDGLCVMDWDGKIVLFNEGFTKIASHKDVEGKFYYDLIADSNFDKLVKKIKTKRTSFSDEIIVSDNYYISSAHPLLAKNEIVVIFYDMTDFKNLEKIKKDLITNVSHELRTPLTAIKGFIETMEEETSEDHKHYIEIIHRHTNRLINIVEDLLILSKLEQPGTELELSTVNLTQLISNLLIIFDQKIKEKNLKLLIEFNANTPPITADVFKLEQMFINLIDNAIKYTDKGEITIKVFPLKNNIRIEISDTGLGIPDEVKNRIFERFYTVDKSRSRRVGGTGL